VGVFADEDLAGCDLRRNNIHITMPPGLPPEPVGGYQITFDYPRVSEVRYSTKKQVGCSVFLFEQLPRPIFGKLPIITAKLNLPQELEYAVGDFHLDRVRTIAVSNQWFVTGVNFRSLAYQAKGAGAAELKRRWPAWEVDKVQRNFQARVMQYYNERAAVTIRTMFQFFLVVWIGAFAGLVVTYRKSASMSRDESQIILAGYLGGSAPRAVQLAGKMTFLRFLFSMDLQGYVESLLLRQSVALEVTEEWKETKNAMEAALKQTARKPAAITTTTDGSGKPLRRLQKLLSYEPKAREEIELEGEAKRAVAAATKTIVAQRAWQGFDVSGFLPEGLPERQVLAINDILKTLLAGTSGLACFGQHRKNETTLRKAVLNHHPVLTGSPQSYDKGLAWLIREGVVADFSKSKILSYSITVEKDRPTDLGRPLRDFLIAENQKRRGSAR